VLARPAGRPSADALDKELAPAARAARARRPSRGHQLYYFSGDSAPGQENGQGQRSTFLLVNSQGQTVQ
jgi:hypothetical protein